MASRISALAVLAAVGAAFAGATGASAPRVALPGKAPAPASGVRAAATSARASKPRNGSMDGGVTASYFYGELASR